MLRVGLTGGLGSGKSTVARMFSDLGAYVISADEIGSRLMQPGQEVYATIARTFGKQILKYDGSLDRPALAKLAFQREQPSALSRIVHPAVIAEQEKWANRIFAKDPAAVTIVESALVFEVEKWQTAPEWTKRFDRVISVIVPEDVKIARFVSSVMAARGAKEDQRPAVEADARARLALQVPDREKIERSDYIIENTGTLEDARKTVTEIYGRLKADAADPNHKAEGWG